jgi:hypothetical protein
MISRRYLFPLPALLLLARCGASGSASVTLAQAKAYADDLINALSAAAQSYLAAPSAANKALVTSIVTDLQQAKVAIDAATAESDARGIALQIVALAQQLVPLVVPFLGPAGPYVPLAIAVIQAFIASLPPPPAAPPAPPAALHEMGLRYHPS